MGQIVPQQHRGRARHPRQRVPEQKQYQPAKKCRDQHRRHNNGQAGLQIIADDQPGGQPQNGEKQHIKAHGRHTVQVTQIPAEDAEQYTGQLPLHGGHQNGQGRHRQWPHPADLQKAGDGLQPEQSHRQQGIGAVFQDIPAVKLHAAPPLLNHKFSRDLAFGAQPPQPAAGVPGASRRVGGSAAGAAPPTGSHRVPAVRENLVYGFVSSGGTSSLGV